MKVKCKPFNTTDRKIHSSRISEGSEYHVLSVYADKQKIFFYRIVGDDKETPVLFESQDFILISSLIPKNWIVDCNDDIFELAPKSWLEPGFWESYF